jgi:hypothetical protein
MPALPAGGQVWRQRDRLGAETLCASCSVINSKTFFTLQVLAADCASSCATAPQAEVQFGVRDNLTEPTMRQFKRVTRKSNNTLLSFGIICPFH